MQLPVPATDVLDPAFRRIATFQHSAEASAYAQRLMAEYQPAAPRYRGYCLTYIEHTTAECLQLHGRLPTAEEFFCNRGCRRILSRQVQVPPEGMKQRAMCRECRNRQVRLNEKRRWGLLRYG